MKWGAVIAGTATAIAIWMLLQLFGSGIALAAFDARDLDRMRGIGIGTTAWSVLAPLIALFLGGMLAARIAGHHERRVAGVHGLLVWAFTTILGVVTVTSSIAMMTPALAAHSMSSGDMGQRALMTASDAGSAFLVASLALALGLIAAVGGALTAGQAAVRRRRLDTEPGVTTPTAPYPPVERSPGDERIAHHMRDDE